MHAWTRFCKGDPHPGGGINFAAEAGGVGQGGYGRGSREGLPAAPTGLPISEMIDF